MAAMALLSGADVAVGGQVRAMPLASIAICSKQAYKCQSRAGGYRPGQGLLKGIDVLVIWFLCVEQKNNFMIQDPDI